MHYRPPQSNFRGGGHIPRVPRGIYAYVAALCNIGFFLLSIFFFLTYLSGHRLDVYHTSTHGVAVVRI